MQQIGEDASKSLLKEMQSLLGRLENLEQKFQAELATADELKDLKAAVEENLSSTKLELFSLDNQLTTTVQELLELKLDTDLIQKEISSFAEDLQDLFNAESGLNLDIYGITDSINCLQQLFSQVDSFQKNIKNKMTALEQEKGSLKRGILVLEIMLGVLEDLIDLILTIIAALIALVTILSCIFLIGQALAAAAIGKLLAIKSKLLVIQQKVRIARGVCVASRIALTLAEGNWDEALGIFKNNTDLLNVTSQEICSNNRALDGLRKDLSGVVDNVKQTVDKLQDGKKMLENLTNETTLTNTILDAIGNQIQLTEALVGDQTQDLQEKLSLLEQTQKALETLSLEKAVEEALQTEIAQKLLDVVDVKVDYNYH